MTRTPTTTRRAPRLRRLIAAATLAGAVVAGGAIGADGGRADASARTSSTVIAGEADRALVALDQWRATRDPADYVRFVQGRERTAALTAADLEIDGDALAAAWAGIEPAKQEAVLAALSQLGVPYRSMKSEPGVGFDCSGLTSWAFGRAGIELPRSSGDQIRAIGAVEREAAEPGDLTYYPGHVSIYLGVGSMVHSPNSGNTVEAAPLPDRSLRFGDPLIED
jgi:cell wall-associated NlpC family hydrolase